VCFSVLNIIQPCIVFETLSDRVITTLVSYYMSGTMLSILYSELCIIPMVIK
jgi:hypothetical protein